MQKCESLLRYLFIIHTFRPYNPRLQGLFFFIYLCVDLRHKQKHTTSSLVHQVFLLNKSMKNSIHKQKHTATRSKLHALHQRPTQKHTADQGKLHAPHHRKTVAILQHLFFFYLCIDYKHKHTADQGACYVVHALNCVNFFYFFYLQTTSTSTTTPQRQRSRAR